MGPKRLHSVLQLCSSRSCLKNVHVVFLSETGAEHLLMKKTGSLINVFIFSKEQLWPNEHLSLEDVLRHTVML